MPRKEAISRWSHLFFMPSLYGGVMWGAALALYGARLVEWERNSAYTTVIFLIVEAAFISSVVLFSPMYRSWLSAQRSTDGPQLRTSSPIRLIVLLHSIGFIGLAKYVIDFSEGFGGIEGFIIALFSQSYLIRGAAEDTFSIGIQLSYFGWIAIALTVLQVTQKRISRWWLTIALLQFCGNLMFIDRTRPIWILFTSFLMVLLGLPKLNVLKILRWATLGCVMAVTAFLGIAEWIGKIPEEGTYGTSTLTPQAENVYHYITAGFPYFNRILEEQRAVSYVPERTLYPAAKMLSSLNLVEPPPSQINDFEYLPFETNVGTFLEPLYRDGGILFVTLGIITYSFCLDLVGLKLLRSRTLLTTYAWANICFVSLMGFFTPKLSTFPVWLFLGIALLSLCWLHLRFSKS